MSSSSSSAVIDVVVDLTAPGQQGSDCSRKREHHYLAPQTLHRLCIHASDVATIAGYNSFANPCDLFDKYIYQDCEYLRDIDAQELGLQLVTKEEEVERVLGGLSSGNEIKEILQLKAGNKRAKVAGEIAAAIQATIDESSRKHEVSSAQDLVVLNSIVSATYKDFGTANERNVIDLYEERMGATVQRLDKLLTIAVYADECVSCVDAPPVTRPDEPLFLIVGRLDGVSTQGEEQVVLEVKNRIRTVFHTPPLRDLIQLVVYLKMVGGQVGHLVQCVYDPDSSAAPAVDGFDIYALDLRKERFHTEEFDRSIVPRLREFSSAVLGIRADDGARSEWLRQDERYRLAVVMSSCDFLEDAVQCCEERLTKLERKAAGSP